MRPRSAASAVAALLGFAAQPLWADEVAPALGPNDHNPAYIARKTVEQIQVVAPILRLRLEPDLGSLVVGEADRGQLFTVLEQRADWFRVRIKSDPETSAWALREPAEYGDSTFDLIYAAGDTGFAAEAIGATEPGTPAIDAARPAVPRRVVTLPPIDPEQLPPPQANLPRESVPIPDRWRLMQALGFKFPWYDPYNQNVLKGDIPVHEIGEEWFFTFTGISDSLAEFRSTPLPVSQQIGFRPDANNIYGRYDQRILAQNLILSFGLVKGNTTYKPPELEFRFVPVINYVNARLPESGLLRVNPQEGLSRETSFVGIQEAFVDYHLRNVSDRYDFDSLRVGIQPFTSDFRGFLFQDTQFGVRLFGNRHNNVYQYNLAWFRRVEKDTNSGLNDITRRLRDDDIFAANVYRQDFPFTGMTSQGTVIHNRNNEDSFRYDTNGFLVRPSLLGDARPRKYQVTYLGATFDGHTGFVLPKLRLNVSSSTYLALGHDDHGAIAEKPQDIRAFFHATEVSRDFSWIRLRGSFLYASGDKNPYDGRATGFDAIFENPQFAGADTSYFIRQGIPLIGGGGVALSGRNGLLVSLRSSKDQGQSNFVNPGLLLLGMGADFDVKPEPDCQR
ncbi:MAG: SH3 domain-containing protein [Betaproteobacteria bacterium]|nr:SH3 domain-containing protein [Betaproteobacteria bacterium]